MVVPGAEGIYKAPRIATRPSSFIPNSNTYHKNNNKNDINSNIFDD